MIARLREQAVQAASSGVLPESAPQELAAELESWSQAWGGDLVDLGTEADEETIRATTIAQPLTLAASLLSWRILGSPTPAVVAGHSVGRITALVIAGALSPQEALRLIRVRAQAMAACTERSPGSMVALLTRDVSAAMAAIQDAGLSVATVNSSAQVVASGSLEALASFQAPAGMRLLPLKVGGAFHSPLMDPARLALQEELEALALPSRPLTCAFISDGDGRLHPAGSPSSPLVADLPAAITAPVRWDLVQERIAGFDLSRAVELAPAGALSGFARRELKSMDCGPWDETIGA